MTHILQQVLASPAFVAPRDGRLPAHLRHVLVVLEACRPLLSPQITGADVQRWNDAVVRLARSPSACVRHSASWLVVATLREGPALGIGHRAVDEYGAVLLTLLRAGEASHTRAVAARAAGFFARVVSGMRSRSRRGPGTGSQPCPGAIGAGIVSNLVPLLVGIAGGSRAAQQTDGQSGGASASSAPYSPAHAAHALRALADCLELVPRDMSPFRSIIDRCCVSHFVHESCAAVHSQMCARAAASCFARLHYCAIAAGPAKQAAAGKVGSAGASRSVASGKDGHSRSGRVPSPQAVVWHNAMVQAIAAAEAMADAALGTKTTSRLSQAPGVHGMGATCGGFAPLIDVESVDAEVTVYRFASLCGCIRELLGQSLAFPVRVPVSRMLGLVNHIVDYYSARPPSALIAAAQSHTTRLAPRMYHEVLSTLKCLFRACRRNMLPWLSKVAASLLRGLDLEVSSFLRPDDRAGLAEMARHAIWAPCQFEASLDTACACLEIFGACAARCVSMPLVPLVCAVLGHLLDNTGDASQQYAMNGRKCDANDVDVARSCNHTENEFAAAAETARTLLVYTGYALPKPLRCKLYQVLVRSVAKLTSASLLGRNPSTICRRSMFGALFAAVSTCGALGEQPALLPACLDYFSAGCSDPDAICAKECLAGVVLCQSLLCPRL